MRKMKFILFTPHRKLPEIECDSVKLNIADSVDGSFSGAYGIRKGHAKAVCTLKEGRICVLNNNQEVFTADCGEGFATVDGDEVRVTVDSAEI